MSELQEKTTTTEEPLTPKKKRAMLEYLGIMFAAAFLLVALSLLVKMHAMQDDLDAANTGARENIEQMENDLDAARTENDALHNELDATVRSAKAAELLALAQDAHSRRDTVAFQGYMAELDGYADALGEKTHEIYENLTEYLKNK